MPGDRPRDLSAVLPWILFAALLLTLMACDLDVNPILDEQQWLQAGLGTVHHRFLHTGLVSGSVYGLANGVLLAVVYLTGAVVRAFDGPLDFVSWFLAHQGFFYFLARALTAGIAAGGLVLLSWTLAPRIGPGPAALLTLGFAVAVPAVDRIAYATPHGSMIGYAAALIALLLRARSGASRLAWAGAGAVLAAAAATMIIGLGLGLLAAWGAIEGGPGRGRRIGLLCAGFAAGFVLFGYPILLNPAEFWESGVRYQISRQVLTDTGGHGRILLDWALGGSTLWLAAAAGLIWGRFPEGRALAAGAFATAAGYVVFLAAATRSSQVSYSLAALPCLAYAASGLVEPLRAWPAPKRWTLIAAVFLFSAGPALLRVYERVAVPHPRVIAAQRVRATQPAGTSILVDTWYGPHLRHPQLLLAPYGDRGRDWWEDPAFRASLQRRLPAEDQQWTILPYPGPLRPEALQRVDLVVISDYLKSRNPLFAEDVLQPEGPEGPGGVGYYKVRR